MTNALGQPQHVALFGGTSEIARAAVREWVADGATPQVTVAARPSVLRDEVVAEFTSAGLAVRAVDFDAEDTASHPRVLDEVFAGEDVDVAVVAFGVLGDEEEAWQDHASAVRHAAVNYTGAVSVGVLLGQHLRAQGRGHVVALSSVAGERVRRSNFVYGSSKAGMDGFYLGLGEALAEHGVGVSVIRPGQVRTRMSAGRDDAPLTVDAEVVGRAVVRAVASGTDLVWVPAAFRPVMSALRHVPRPIFRKLPI